MRAPTAIYPGTFDPITYGHLDVIRRAATLFPRVIVLVARNTSKEPLFSADERVAMVRSVVRSIRGVSTDCFDGLLVSYARKHSPSVLVRGLRAVSDFEYEFQMALTNRKLLRAVDTVFLVPDERYTYLNSSIVREVARLNGDVADFVPPLVRRRLMVRVWEHNDGRRMTAL
jgi:pantetheine-phosphate adenylyltransferase